MKLTTLLHRHQSHQSHIPTDYTEISGSASEYSASIDRLNHKPLAGLMSYHLYVELDRAGYWTDRKAVEFGYCGGICQVCHERKAVTCHHTTYINTSREEVGDLIPVCRWCHDHHFHQDKLDEAAARQETQSSKIYK